MVEQNDKVKWNGNIQVKVIFYIHHKLSPKNECYDSISSSVDWISAASEKKIHLKILVLHLAHNIFIHLKNNELDILVISLYF